MTKVAVVGIGVIMLTVIVFGGIFAIAETKDNSEAQQRIENETFVPTGGEIEVFENSRIDDAAYERNVVVRNGSDLVVIFEGDNDPNNPAQNYTWFPDNGTLRVTSGSNLANADNATITYEWIGHTASQNALINVITDANEWMVMVVFVGFVMLGLAGIITMMVVAL